MLVALQEKARGAHKPRHLELGEPEVEALALTATIPSRRSTFTSVAVRRALLGRLSAERSKVSVWPTTYKRLDYQQALHRVAHKQKNQTLCDRRYLGEAEEAQEQDPSAINPSNALPNFRYLKVMQPTETKLLRSPFRI